MGNSVMWLEASNKSILGLPFYVLEVVEDFELQVRDDMCWCLSSTIYIWT